MEATATRLERQRRFIRKRIRADTGTVTNAALDSQTELRRLRYTSGHREIAAGAAGATPNAGATPAHIARRSLVAAAGRRKRRGTAHHIAVIHWR